jgi:hypothetical protein
MSAGWPSFYVKTFVKTSRAGVLRGSGARYLISQLAAH